MNNSNKYHITENLLITEKKRKKNKIRKKFIYQKFSFRFSFRRHWVYAFFILSSVNHCFSNACNLFAIISFDDVFRWRQSFSMTLISLCKDEWNICYIIQINFIKNDMFRKEFIKNNIFRRKFIKNDIFRRKIIKNDIFRREFIKNNMFRKEFIKNDMFRKKWFT